MSNYSSEQEFYPDNCDEEMSILDILIVLAEQKKLIIGTVLLFTLAGLLYAFFLTELKYSSEVQMMPLTSSVLDNGDFAVQMPGNIVGGVILSNATLDAVIDEFGLLKTKDGGSQSRITARRELEKDIKVDIDKNSVITLKVDASEPETAMKMANFIYNKTVGTLEDMGITATVSNKDAYLEGAIKKKINEIEKKSSDGGGSPKITSLLDLYTMLTQYDENRKIKDKSPMVIQLISPASLPDEKAPQGRGKIVALSALLGLFCAVMLAFARHFWKSSDEDAATAEKKKRLRMLLRS
ncbi:MAG: Wzz/FepE/Etk N-terminal domain-containing protein [Cloacibacillus porcorum]|uniref:Wzz/FepE/Etk N-terminal domain-containing protein n=1 Tax=Cloacibacillus porcorum TaxID=1197717 RepID=UPI0023549341|nr:Wzz/FepE/Etk N-terminal domain-containing protein [Cloacibacillus porcorum]MCI5864909.1 Wzz/FepE/Etk N-terminal domain-containing protein [Cloacibacillus porcorum]MDD7648538.1 Wzz/FepE/Etk N-terminal domain-containing protein [Cloacibacillus porcorum]MDY4092789.1 Wzz/FepE/Etk N-terminal domain-containing protein [Cloacibacillus porcorum]